MSLPPLNIVAAGDGELGPAERVPPGDRHPPVRGQHRPGHAEALPPGQGGRMTYLTRTSAADD